jgi:hypothetical protein
MFVATFGSSGIGGAISTIENIVVLAEGSSCGS